MTKDAVINSPEIKKVAGQFAELSGKEVVDLSHYYDILGEDRFNEFFSQKSLFFWMEIGNSVSFDEFFKMAQEVSKTQFIRIIDNDVCSFLLGSKTCSPDEIQQLFSYYSFDELEDLLTINTLELLQVEGITLEMMGKLYRENREKFDRVIDPDVANLLKSRVLGFDEVVAASTEELPSLLRSGRAEVLANARGIEERLSRTGLATTFGIEVEICLEGSDRDKSATDEKIEAILSQHNWKKWGWLFLREKWNLLITKVSLKVRN